MSSKVQQDAQNTDIMVLYDKFNKLLNSTKITGKQDVEITHTNMGKTGGKYSIMGENYAKFLKLYSQLYKHYDLSLVERHISHGKHVGPFIIDIDYKTLDNERYYTEDHILKIVKMMAKIFKKYVNIDKDDILAYISEKKRPTEEIKNEVTLYKDGFHIYFDIPLSENKRKYLYSVMKEEEKNINVFEDIPYDKTYTTKIFDDSVLYANGLLMYGSKKPNKAGGFLPPYKLTKIFSHKGENVTDDYDLTQDNLIAIFSLRQYDDKNDIVFIDEDLENEFNNPIVKKSVEKKEKIIQMDIDESIFIEDVEKPHAKNEVVELIKLLSVERATEYDKWIRVCWAIKNVSVNLFSVFDNFSKQARNYDKKGCLDMWHSANIKKTGYTIASLRKWAKEDNPEKYEKMCYDEIKNIIDKVDKCNHNNVSNIVREIYKDTFVCADYSKNEWYEYRENRWAYVDSGYTLLEKIASDMNDIFSDIMRYTYISLQKETGQQKDEQTKLFKKISEITAKLGDQSYGKVLIETCKRKFYDDQFKMSLNEQHNLLGFNNGIYDFSEKIFRKGCPDDRITFTTGYDYVEYVGDEPVFREINEYFRKIHVDKDMREYFLIIMASCLHGGNKQQQFYIFTGKTASNGKSKTMEFFSKIFGDYATPCPSDIVTDPRKSGQGPSPYMANKKGKRLVTFVEPEKDDVLIVGRVKEMTGNDEIETRTLNEKPFRFTPQYTPVMICNDIPGISGTDEGIMRRLNVVPFESKFVEKDADPSKRKFLRDPHINEKLEKWVQPLAWLLINVYYDKYLEYVKNGANPPDKVKAYTKKYKEESDSIFNFFSECVEIVDNEEETLTLKILYDSFKIYYRDTYTSKCIITKNNIKDYVIDKLDKSIVKDKITGIRFTKIE